MEYSDIEYSDAKHLAASSADRTNDKFLSRLLWRVHRDGVLIAVVKDPLDAAFLVIPGDQILFTNKWVSVSVWEEGHEKHSARCDASDAVETMMHRLATKVALP